MTFKTTIIVLINLMIMFEFAMSSGNCAGKKIGYYCTGTGVNNNDYVWCFGQDTGSQASCGAGLVCKCGFTTSNPCSWSFQTPSPCTGAPGSIIGPNPQPPQSSSSEEQQQDTSSAAPPPPTNVFQLNYTEHMSLALNFHVSKWMDQLKALVAKPFYNSADLYAPEGSNYQCSYHPPSKYDKNPSQIWIARPSKTVTVSYTQGLVVRLPDRYFGMAFAYAMDHYGMNPSMLLGLGMKESFLGAVYQTVDNNYFVVKDGEKKFDGYAPGHLGIFTDNNNDGPFQVETPGMSSDVTAFPQRFYTGNPNVPKSKRVPTYPTDNELMILSTFRQYHDFFTLDNIRSVVLASLDMHFRHNLLVQMKKMGFYDSWLKRTDRLAKDSLEFAAIMFTYNRGIFQTALKGMLDSCSATADPAKDCGLDGYGGHTTNIRDVCILLDTAPANEIYDFQIQSDELAYFLDTLESTYPYEVTPYFKKLDWAQIRSDAQAAFTFLESNRKQKSGSTSGISFRYDWRALLGVIRMRLPTREVLLGPSVQNFYNYWGAQLSPKLGPYQSTSSYPVDFCTEAGGGRELCGTPDQTVPSSDSSSSGTVQPSDCIKKQTTCHSNLEKCLSTLPASVCDCASAWKTCVMGTCVTTSDSSLTTCTC